ncbi:AraC family transcriptional regulator [Streptomyces sp. NA04227]|uniref:AraC family transcriptional regulator n=1 Tax=Streptomyces sp. NA04227 TaxID=2742136 RepID=UPI001591E968|nr:AraC family transcriptional regulator [Streptomyces sp. NA04227]QKW07540.1 AraC family transcriptional regulator [Streptomyces sp. NA04227]
MAVVRTQLERRALGVALLAEVAAERGVPQRRLFAGSGLSAAAVNETGAYVTAEQELTVVGNLVDACPEPALGLVAGSRYHLSAYGPWGLALLSSPTVGSAIDLGLRYLGLTYALCDISFEQGAESVALVLGTGHLPPPTRRFLAEREAAAIRMMQREIVGTAAHFDYAFAFPAPADPAPYRECFGSLPAFDAPRTTLSGHPDLLAAPLPQADPRIAALSTAECHRLLSVRAPHGGLARQVLDLLLRSPARMPAVEEAAAELHLSARTLRRRLAEEQTGYRRLVAEARAGLAEEFLVAGLSTQETARRLGYSEPAGFIHAFHGWRGMTPSRFVRQEAERAGSRAPQHH